MMNNQWKQTALDMLNHNGTTMIPSLPKEHVDSMLNYWADKLVYNAHVSMHSTEPPVTFAEALKQNRWQCFSLEMKDVVSAPYFFEIALGVMDLVFNYFGEMPKLYSMNVFWTQPASGPQYADTHAWHRDGDDRKQLAMFLYGTPVIQRENGAHLYQKGTHILPPGPGVNERQLLADQRLGRDPNNCPPETLVTILGDTGTMFLSDPNGLHMGLRPNQLRMLAWARFGVSEPTASYVWDHMSPVSKSVLVDRYPTDPSLQEAIRMVVS